MLVISLVLIAFTYLNNAGYVIQSSAEDRSFDAEYYLSELATLPNEFASVRDYLQKISRTYGGEKGFIMLREGVLPSGMDIHLLGHAIGDVLYNQEGIEGMQYCTHEFRNACSHSIVIGGLLEHGMGIFDHIHEACARAPGGTGAYTMCFHGFGHGVLAFTDYDLPQAIEICKKAGTAEYGFQEYHQCVGGVIMELHSGVHDEAVWRENAKQYIDFENPTQMCERDYIEEGAKRMCYAYISPYIFDAAGWRFGNLTDEVVENSFAICSEVPSEFYRMVCSANLGKEFIVLAENRDIRNMEDISDRAVQQSIHWCSLALDKSVESVCVQEIVNSLYWGGENHYSASLRFCAQVNDRSVRDDCFMRLFGNVSYYRDESTYWQELCEAVPNDVNQACLSAAANG